MFAEHLLPDQAEAVHNEGGVVSVGFVGEAELQGEVEGEVDAAEHGFWQRLPEAVLFYVFDVVVLFVGALQQVDVFGHVVEIVPEVGKVGVDDAGGEVVGHFDNGRDQGENEVEIHIHNNVAMEVDTDVGILVFPQAEFGMGIGELERFVEGGELLPCAFAAGQWEPPCDAQVSMELVCVGVFFSEIRHAIQKRHQQFEAALLVPQRIVEGGDADFVLFVLVLHHQVEMRWPGHGPMAKVKADEDGEQFLGRKHIRLRLWGGFHKLIASAQVVAQLRYLLGGFQDEIVLRKFDVLGE